MNSAFSLLRLYIVQITWENTNVLLLVVTSKLVAFQSLRMQHTYKYEDTPLRSMARL